jgi:hypothetical protein
MFMSSIVFGLPQGGMRSSARLQATQQQTGASTPIRPEFEEDVREVNVRGRPA